MINYKFTADGKKVAVIGYLNAKETIVQEIFVYDGTEFPAGEHFVVKTLLGVPAETYEHRKERELKENIKKLEKDRDILKNEISRFIANAAAASEKVKWIKGITEPEVEKVFENIKSVLCNEYTHIVFKDYHGLIIEEWNVELFSQDDRYGENRGFNGIRMVSLYGVWNKRLEMDWRVYDYRDGSGSSEKFTPCKSLQEAIDYCAGVINSQDCISDKDVDLCLKYNIPVDKEKNAKRIKMKRDLKEKEIAQTKERLEKQIAELAMI